MNILPICTHPQDFRRTDLARDADAHPRSQTPAATLENLRANSTRTHVSHVLARAHRTRCRIRTYQRSAQLSSSCSTTGRAPLLRRTDPANRTDAKVRLPTVSEDIIMVRVRARHAGGQAVSSADQAARSARGKAWPFCTWDCFKNTALPLHRTSHEQQALVRWERERRCVRCVFFFSCGSSRAMVNHAIVPAPLVTAAVLSCRNERTVEQGTVAHPCPRRMVTLGVTLVPTLDLPA